MSDVDISSSLWICLFPKDRLSVRDRENKAGRKMLSFSLIITNREIYRI